MSDGMIKIKEDYIKEAENRSKSYIQRCYGTFKQRFAGSINESSVGIEKYRNILMNELTNILALQINFEDIVNGRIIDDDTKSTLRKYERVIKESEGGLKEKESDRDDVYTKYALFGGYGSACLNSSKELDDCNHSLLKKMSDTIGELNIAQSTGALSVIEKDTRYIPKIISVLKEKKIITNQKEVDTAILFAKNKLSNLRYNLQKEELLKLSTSGALNKIRKTRIEVNGFILCDLEVEDAKTQRKVEGDVEKKLDVEEIEWGDVIGQEDAKKRLRDEAVRYLGTYDRTTKKSIFEGVVGAKPPKTILLYGPPGTGKTFSLKAVITEAEKIRRNQMKKGKDNPKTEGIHYNIITPDMIKNKYIGESSKAIKRVFDTAKKNAPSLLVIDELDALSSKRGAEGFNEGEREIMAILMQELSGIQKSRGYILVGITNIPKCLDKALLSRFVVKVKFTKPKNTKEVADLFKVYLRSLVKIGALRMNEEKYRELGRIGLKLEFTGRWVKQFVEALERERNEMLTLIYKNNVKIISTYQKNSQKMKEILNKKCKKFTIEYITKKMTKFATDNKDSQTYMI